ncbi:MAG: 30S ribosomal protein S2 [Phycisphaerae bacterium]|nr:30S ribosomal protein S2 [Phycisphaerae bacterium]
MASELVRELVDSGIHFGHRVSRWNPKMSPYIFGKRNMIHVIDIRETVKGLIRAKKFIARTVAENGDVLFVGTKRQARHAVESYARQAGMPFVAERWLGGTLTNFETIRSRLARLELLEREEADGTLLQYSKKRIARDNRERRKIKRNLDGIRTMTRLPKALVVVDVHREHIAVKEAKKLGIPTICLIDTDSDPDFADIPIPGNDDSMRSIEVVLRHMAAAVESGKRGRVEAPQEEGPDAARRRRTRRTATARAETDAEPAGVGADAAPADRPAPPAAPTGSTETGEAAPPA